MRFSKKKPIKFIILITTALFITLTGISPLQAKVKLPALFDHNMVLQRNIAAPLWGWAEPGQTLTVTGSWDNTPVSAKADKEGKWMARLNTPSAGGPYNITIEGTEKTVLKNVMIGDVWLCSGQSNMHFPVRKCNRAEQTIENAHNNSIRLFYVERVEIKTPQKDCTADWQICYSENVGDFSAVAYFFGQELQDKLNIPIGLIESARGGSAVQRWIPSGDLPVDKKQIPIIKGCFHGLYNGMIYPLKPFAITGCIWYQGERNANRRLSQADQYQSLFSAMIRSWRNQWGQGNFPFGFVQLPNYRKVSDKAIEDTQWAQLRQAQLQTLKTLDNVGMAVTIDIGEADNIHPTNKYDVGQRLSKWALAKVYDRDIVYSGPTYKSMNIKDGKAIISFDHVEGGLTAKGDKKIKGFAIAGDDRNFIKAKAAIKGNSVVVYSDQVPKPAAVRYAWADNPVCNLYNEAGLPASPFRTDDWNKVNSEPR